MMLWNSTRSADPSTAVAYGSTAIRAYAHAHAPESANQDGFRSWAFDADVSRAEYAWRIAYAAAIADPVPIPKMVVFAPEGRIIASERITTEAAALATLRTIGGP